MGDEERYENDLTQLSGIDEELEKRLKEQGYETLWEVAYEISDVLAVAAGVTRDAAKNIIATANRLLGLEEEEE